MSKKGVDQGLARRWTIFVCDNCGEPYDVPDVRCGQGYCGEPNVKPRYQTVTVIPDDTEALEEVARLLGEGWTTKQNHDGTVRDFTFNFPPMEQARDLLTALLKDRTP